MSLLKYSFVGLHPISQTFGDEVEILGGRVGGVGHGGMCVRPPAGSCVHLQTVAPNERYS